MVETIKEIIEMGRDRMMIIVKQLRNYFYTQNQQHATLKFYEYQLINNCLVAKCKNEGNGDRRQAWVNPYKGRASKSPK